LAKRNPDFFVQELRILPEVFKVMKNSIYNQGLGLSLNIGYKNFKDFKEFHFPHQVLIEAQQLAKSI
jgi:hypothetical protein